jgi:ribose transport system permease protein
MEQNKIFVPGNLHAPAEYLPVPVYFENARWRLAANGVWLGLQIVVLIMLAAIASGLAPVFLDAQNIGNLTGRIVYLALPAAALAVVFANGSLDLSMGPLAALVGFVAATSTEPGTGIMAGALLGMALAVAVGLFNGFVAAAARLPGFLVTLAVSILLGSLVVGLSDGKTVMVTEPMEGIPVICWIAFLLVAGAVALWIQFPAWGANRKTRAGETFPPLGIRLVRVGAPYLLTAVAAGLIGLWLLFRIRAATPHSGAGLELEIVLAVVLGGTCLYGRFGNIPAVFLGAVTVVTLENALSIMNVGPIYFQLAEIALLVLGVGFAYFFHFIVGLIYRGAVAAKGSMGNPSA